MSNQQQQQVGSGGGNKDPEEPVSQSLEIVAKAAGAGLEKAEQLVTSEEESVEKPGGLSPMQTHHSGSPYILSFLSDPPSVQFLV